jgi:hypothetical protein
MSERQENWYNDPHDPGPGSLGDGASWGEAPQPDQFAAEGSWQQPPVSPAVPGRPVPGVAGSPRGQRSKGLLIWGGAVAGMAVIVVIAVAVSIHHSGGSTQATLSAHSAAHSGRSGHSGTSVQSSQSGQSGVQPSQPAQAGQQSSGSGSAGNGSLTSQPQLCQSVVEPVVLQSDADFVQVMTPPQNANLQQQLVNAYRQAAQRASSDPQLAQDLSAEANDLQKTFSDLDSDSEAGADNAQGDWDQAAQEGNAVLAMCQPEAATWYP